MKRYTFFDTESVWDPALHEAYQSIDSRQHERRIGCRRITAAAAFDLEISNEGHIACEGIRSWTEHDYGDEQAVVANLFDHLKGRPDRLAVGYGSVGNDLPILTLAAMEAGLQLPPQFLPAQPGAGRNKQRMHLDLGLSLKASGKTWHHLTEVGLRVGLPASLFIGKVSSFAPTSAQGWKELRAHVETDCALLAIATLAWERTQGQACLNPKIAAIVILDWLRRNGHMTDEKKAVMSDTCQAFAEEIALHHPLAA